MNTPIMKPGGKRYKILLVEDNDMDISIFSKMLEQSEIPSVLTIVKTLEDGISQMRDHIQDIIFLDITLPDSDGILTFQSVKQNAGQVPVVIITANEDEQFAIEALRDGAQDYLIKSKISPVLLSRSLKYSIERKKIELELIRSRANHEAIVENTEDGIWTVDRDLRLITMNSSFNRMALGFTGRNAEAGEIMSDFFPDHLHSFLTGLCKKAIEGERLCSETEVKGENGTSRFIEFSVNPIVTSDDIISGVSFFTRDVSARRHAETQVQKSEEAYKLLLETINEGIMFIDNDNIIRFVNKKFLELTGYREQEINGTDFRSLLDTTDPFSERNVATEILVHEKTREMKFLHKNGNNVWFSVKGTPLLDDHGIVGGTLLTHTEITARINAEREVKKKEQDFSDLLEAMNEGLVYLDRAGQLKFANGKFEELTGFKIPNLLGCQLPEQILPSALLNLLSSEEKNTEGEEDTRQYQYEIQVTRSSGEAIWCMISCSIIEDENRNFNGLLITFADVSVRKKTEDKLQLAQRELNTFIYRSSHDLKGPLSSILGLINILEKEDETSPHSPCIKMIKQSAEKLDRMLNEMLNVVRIKREKIFPEKIDFYNQVNEVIVGLRSNDAFYDVARKINIENKKPVHTDKKLFNLILNNLMDNSIKYRNTAVESFVSVNVADYMHGVKITVEDNGVGFTGTARENIFNMFNKGNYKSDGNGLGLYVVKNAVDRLGGYVELSCEPGENTCITIFLPDLYSANQWAGKAVEATW